MASPGSNLERKLQMGLKNIKEWNDYFEPNNNSYHNSRNFLYSSTVSDREKSMNQLNKKATTEYNLLLANVKRLEGQFTYMMPWFTVHAKQGAKNSPQMDLLIEFIQDHFAATFEPSANDWMALKQYNHGLTGGFANSFIYPKYLGEMSVDQGIAIESIDDPTMVGYDIRSKLHHKGDGKYAYELIPVDRDILVDRYGNKVKDNVGGDSTIAGVTWQYNKADRDVVLVCSYYYKEEKEGKIVKLSDGRTMKVTDYERMLDKWTSYLPAPVPIHKPIKKKFTTISHCLFTDGEILEEHKNTVYDDLPYVFWDFSSQVLATNITGNTYQQITMPYTAKAMDSQRTKNVMGQMILTSAVTADASTYIIPEESLPRDPSRLRAWTDPNFARIKTYKATLNGDPTKPLPPPQPAQQASVSPEFFQMFIAMDSLIQAQLSTFDPTALGTNGNDMSGKAVRQGTIAAAMAAMPFMTGIEQGMQRNAQIYMHLMPKIMITPRTVPVMKIDGSREYIMINEPKSLTMEFDPQDFQVDVECGVTCDAQKQDSLDAMYQMAQILPNFAQFLNDEGIPTLLDNYDIRNVEALKAKYEEWQEKQQEQQQQQQGQPNPEMIQLQIAQQKVQNDQMELKFKEIQLVINTLLKKRDQEIELVTTMANVVSGEEKDDVAAVTALAKIDQGATEMELKKQQADAENTRSAVDLMKSLDEHAMKREEHEMNKESHVKMMSQPTQTDSGAEA